MRPIRPIAVVLVCCLCVLDAKKQPSDGVGQSEGCCQKFREMIESLEDQSRSVSKI